MAKTPWQPPSGIRYKFQKNRPNPYVLVWTDAAGVEHSKAYRDEARREIAARALAEKRAKEGDAILRFDPVEWRRYLEFRDIIGPDVDPVIVAHEWRAAKQGNPKALGMPVRDGFMKYLALRAQEQNWGADAHRHAKKHLERFSGRYGDLGLNEVSADDVRDWLFGKSDASGRRTNPLLDDDGKAIGPHGIKDHLKSVRTFFKYAVREGWGALANPCEHIAPPNIADGDPIVIPVRDAFQLFKLNRDERTIGRIALEAFGAVRYTTVGLLQKAAIDVNRCGIRMAARIHKTGKKDGRTRYRQGQPANLWNWLRHVPGSCWEMTPLQYREGKRNALIRAALRPVENVTDHDATRIVGLRNIWRHSFISYHLARFKCPTLTQYLAQHASLRQTEEYEGMADETDAARYFMITPETVLLSWEEFSALPILPVQASELAALVSRTAA